MARRLTFLLGFFLVFLGLIGIIIPLLPTTIFFILAAGCFARSSPKFEQKLLNDPRFGPAIRNWRNHGAIPKRAKFYAMIGMSLGFILFLWRVHPNLYLAGAVLLLLFSIAIYILTRPSEQDHVSSSEDTN